MGKNWKAFHSSGGGGSKNDFSSCRGFAVIMGTCDAAREREATKELINILTTETEMNHDLVASDEMDRSKVDDVHGSLKGNLSSSLSVEDILKNEINEIKQQRHNGSNSSIQFFTSINTGIKGIVLVRVNRKSLCPVRLLKSLFDRIRFTKLQVSRYLAKIIPLQICFFPTEVDLVATLKLVINKEFVDCIDKSLPCLNDESLKSKKRTIDQVHGSNDCSDGDNFDDTPDHASSGIEASTMVNNPSKEIKDSSSTPPVDIAPSASVVATRAASTYLLLFKARNHNVLSKTSCLQHLRQLMPPHMKQDYINSHNAIIIEALKNLGGISYFPDFYEYCELNIRKFQSECISLDAVAVVIEPEDVAVVEPEEKDTAVIEPEEKDATVIESEEKDAAVIESEEKDVAVVEPEEKDAAAIEPEEEDAAAIEPK